ncbi:hypothetical protein LP7551_01621 [Roseibium album]|nr:hypothetical protein LP7551_01621 [Roseibium album]
MMKLFDRLRKATEHLEPVHSKYRVIYEDPDDFDAPAAVLIPDPNFMAAAIAGGIVPPIGSYLLDAAEPDSAPKRHPYAEPLGPMTEEQTIEYLIMKDIPRHVWEYRGNRQIMKIVPVEAIPVDRTFRDAWVINQGE